MITNTITSNTQTRVNFEAAAEEILTVIDGFGFTTDVAFDPQELRNKIVEAIRQKVEGNVNYTIA